MTKRRTEGANGATYWIVAFFEDGPWFDGAYFIRAMAQDTARWWSRQYPRVPVCLFGGNLVEAYQAGESVDPYPLLSGRFLGDRWGRARPGQDDRRYYDVRS